MNQYVLWAGLAVVNLPLIIIYGKFIFGDLQGFIDSVVFWIKPDIFSMIDGDLFDDWWASFKLWVFVASCGAVLAMEYALVAQRLLPSVPTQ